MKQVGFVVGLSLLLTGAPAGTALLADLIDPVIPTAVPQLSGTPLWEARYNGPASNWDWARGIAAHPLGLLVYVTGESTGSGTGLDYATIGYEATTGLPLWTARYDGPTSGPDSGHGIAVHPDGLLVYVTGASRGAAGSGIATVAYHALLGSEVWAMRHEGVGTNAEQMTSVAVAPDGDRVYVTGPIGSYTTSRYVTIAYDAENGAELWKTTFIGAGAGGDEPQDITVSPDGSRVYVTGWSHHGSYLRYDYTTVAYDAADGTVLWDAHHSALDGTYAFARTVQADPDGDMVYVTGGSVGLGTNFDVVTIAYDAATGQEAWLARYDGPASSSDSAWDLAVSPDGSSVFATGFSWGVGTGLDYVTIAYDAATGGELWIARYNGPSNASDFGSALEVAADGMRLYVTGYTWHAGSFQYGTVAYDPATGNEVWVERYNGPSGSDFPNSIAVDPLGLRVFVTGGSAGSGNEYATVAYLDVR